MSERSVQLHLHTPTERQDLDLGQSPSQTLPDAPQDGSAERFRQALSEASTRTSAPPPEDRVALPSGPMGLFGGAPRAPAAGVHPGVLQLMQDSIKGLQVGQEQRGVRMELDDALYPGVAVSVYEDAGAWVAELRCRDSESYRALATPAQDMARQLALALQRDALWRVIDESAGPVAEGDADCTTEAFASSPMG